MNRKRLARLAYTAAADRILALCDAGEINWDAARARLASLRTAYDKRVSDIDLADWLAARGLTNIVRIAA